MINVLLHVTGVGGAIRLGQLAAARTVSYVHSPHGFRIRDGRRSDKFLRARALTAACLDFSESTRTVFRSLNVFVLA